MIYLKRIAIFLFIVVGLFVFGMVIETAVIFVNVFYGTTGLVVCLVLLVIVVAIIDVRIDKHLAKKKAKAKEEFDAELRRWCERKN